MSERQKTCDQRIGSQLEAGIDDIRRLWESYQSGDEEGVDDLGHFHEHGLSFDYVAPGTFGDDQDQGYFRYQISYGGPSSEYRFFVNPDFTVYKVEYWFLDWYDGASRNLYGANNELMMEIFDWFNECGAVASEYDKATN